ncbi:3 beta-hydroxysteroid dehydrogenase type 7-like [Cetorhinus maximus]
MADRPGQVYLVTGGCGFLGRHLVKMLVERGEGISEIRVFDTKVDRELESLSTVAVRVNVIQGDVSEADSVRDAARGVDLIIHTAALIDVWGRNSPSKIWAINYQGTRNVINACKEMGIQFLLHTSSMEVVGPNAKGEHFIRGDEDTPYAIELEGPYAQSKAQAEEMVLSANGAAVAGGKTLVTCALRPTGIYGENNGMMEKLYHGLVKFGRKRLRLAGQEIEHGRVYVGNVAWMHLLAARALRERPGTVGGQAYFCYDDSPYLSYEDFDMQFLGPSGFRMLGHKPLLPYFTMYLLALLAEVLQWLLRPLGSFTPSLNRYTLNVVTTAFTVQTDKAARHFGYKPLVPWAESMARTAGWVRELDEACSKGK